MTTAIESLPTTWTAADELFFRIVGQVFPPEFTAGAGALLAGYDEARV